MKLFGSLLLLLVGLMAKQARGLALWVGCNNTESWCTDNALDGYAQKMVRYYFNEMDTRDYEADKSLNVLGFIKMTGGQPVRRLRSSDRGLFRGSRQLAWCTCGEGTCPTGFCCGNEQHNSCRYKCNNCRRRRSLMTSVDALTTAQKTGTCDAIMTQMHSIHTGLQVGCEL